MIKNITEKIKINHLSLVLFLCLFIIIISLFFNTTSAQVCLPLTGYLVWSGIWEPSRIPMASSSQYFLTASPIFVSGGNVGIGYTSPVYKFQVAGDISGTRLCIGNDCRSVWPGGGVAGTGLAGQVAFWTGQTDLSGDNNFFWDNTNKRLGIGTTIPQTSLHVVGNVTANTFLGTISAVNVSSGQFGANTGGGNYYFMGNVGIGTTNPAYKLDIVGDIRATGNIYGNWSGAINAGNVTPGVFNSLQGGGTGAYAFLGSLGVSTTSQVGLPQALSVYGNGYFSGNVGIGVVNPTSKIQTLASGESNYFIMNTFSNTQTNANGLRTMRARGSSASPSNVANSDGLFYLSSLGYYSGGYRLASEIAMIVDGVPSGTTVPGRIELTTIGSGGGGIAVLKSNGNFGIGTTTPEYKLDVASGGATTARLGATSADTVIIGGGAGKLTVGTVDPVYSINGTNYATYFSGMTGLKEETTGIVTLTLQNSEQKSLSTTNIYKYVIDFNNLEKNSDLWVFWQITDFGKNWEKLTVLLTPNFDGRIWYKKDAPKMTLTILGIPANNDISSQTLEVSYRLTAPRFDWQKWQNIVEDQSIKGIIVTPK